MLHEFVTANREEIIRRCRVTVASRAIPPPSEAEIDHGVPLFLEQLVDALRRDGTPNGDIDASAIQHGHALLLQGFTVSQVVHDYGDICQAITALAGERHASISTDDFRMLNRCLDDAIASAVTEYARVRDQSFRSEEAARGSEQFGFLAHELRNLINTAIVAFEVLKSGNVGPAGSTGAVLSRSLLGARDLIGGSLAEVRLTQGTQFPEPMFVSALVRELAANANLAAQAQGVTLVVPAVEEDVTIEVDRQVMTAVMMNLLQNAIKFTRPRSTVTLRAIVTADRVRLEIEDECGGLAANYDDILFRPFVQRSANRTGLGLGLAFSRWGTEANHGLISARSLPAVGCVFTVDLPRHAVALAVPVGVNRASSEPLQGVQP
jgi:signal transduction histidine kinase